MVALKMSSKHLAFGLIAVFLGGMLVLGPARLADADGPRPGHKIKRKVHDTRHYHNRSYPARGEYIGTLPRRSRVVVHAGIQYHYFGGIWYRPHHSRFIIVSPPIGAMVPFLPPYYTIIWIGGTPFYYANDIYYAHRGDRYVVVAPPQGEVSKVAPSSSQLFIYPSKGQSQEQQADDRYACHSWAVSQTGYDPTRLGGEQAQADSKQGREDYRRAMAACLEARGYSVK
jgi:hypothetical protein